MAQKPPNKPDNFAKKRNKNAGLRNELKFIRNLNEKESSMIQDLTKSISDLEQNIKQSEALRIDEQDRCNNIISEAFKASELSMIKASELKNSLRQAIVNGHHEFFSTNTKIIDDVNMEEANYMEQKLSIEQEFIEVIMQKLGAEIEYKNKEYSDCYKREYLEEYTRKSEIELVRSHAKHIYNLEQIYDNLGKINEENYTRREKEKDLKLWESHNKFNQRLQDLKNYFNQIISKNLNEIRQLQSKHSELKANEFKLSKKLEDLKRSIAALPDIQECQDMKVYEDKLLKYTNSLKNKNRQFEQVNDKIKTQKLQYFILDQNSEKFKKENEMGAHKLRQSIYTSIQKKLLKDSYSSTNYEYNYDFESWISSLSSKLSTAKLNYVSESGPGLGIDFASKDSDFLKQMNDIQVAKLEARESYKNLILAHGGYLD